MANAGYSADYRLLCKICREGCKQYFCVSPNLDRNKRNCNSIANMAILYYHTWIMERNYKRTEYANKAYHSFANQIIRLNQYRLKHWYWEPLKL